MFQHAQYLQGVVAILSTKSGLRCKFFAKIRIVSATPYSAFQTVWIQIATDFPGSFPLRHINKAFRNSGFNTASATVWSALHVKVQNCSLRFD